MKKLTLHQLNKKHDKSDSYFQEMRIRNPKKFRYIMFIGYDNYVMLIICYHNLVKA